MRNRHRTFSRVAALLPIVTLAACGGAGNGGSSATTPIVKVTATPSVVEPAGCGSSVLRQGHSFTRTSPASWVNPNRLYVTYKASAASRISQSVDRAVNAASSVDLGVVGTVGHRLVNLPAGATQAAAIATLRTSSDVTDVEPTHYRRLSALPPLATPPANDAVNDPFSDNVDQWYLYRTDADPDAWNLPGGHGNSAVQVAVIDTGVDQTNTDIDIASTETVLNGVRSTGAQDTNGHGTNVSGLAGAISNNSSGFAGYGYGTPIQAYKIFPDTSATSDEQCADTGDEAVAINDAVTNKASVINLSLGAPQSDGIDVAEQTAVEAAITAGVVVVAANGNEYGQGTDGTTADYPAAYAGVIGVGASALTDSNPNNYNSITADIIASYSNSGPTLVAPGGDATSDPASNNPDVLHWIEGYSTTHSNYSADNCSALASGYCVVLFNGTSQATPQVSGTVALMMSAAGGQRSIAPATVKARLISTATPISGISATRQGAGLLNVYHAVQASE